MVNTTHNMGMESFVWFIAKVEDNNDPEMLGRVKIRVINDHEGIEKKDLLWATPIMPPTSASFNQVGRSPTGLLVGSLVFGFYLDGKEKQFPLIWGAYAKMPKKDQKNNDVPARAREINDVQDDLVGPEPKSPYNAKYPHNHVWKTVGGHLIEVDDTPGQERINVRHNSGTYLEINHDGRLVTKSVDDSYEIVVGDKTVYIKGDILIEVKGDANIKIEGDLSTKVSGDADINVGGSATVKAQEVNMTLKEDFNGKAVNWNFEGNIALAGGSL